MRTIIALLISYAKDSSSDINSYIYAYMEFDEFRTLPALMEIEGSVLNNNAKLTGNSKLRREEEDSLLYEARLFSKNEKSEKPLHLIINDTEIEQIKMDLVDAGWTLTTSEERNRKYRYN